MEKEIILKLDHVYIDDINRAITEARKIIMSSETITEEGIDYKPINYRVVRDKTNIITTIIYKEYGSNNN